jgi:predicted porin
MKKTLIALAAVVATSAFAQSTVTLFGGADLGYRNVTSGENKFSGMSQDGIYSSRFGVSGTEDLGGGLKAGFHFEGGMNPDVGTSASLNFTRKSTIGLSGGFGEVRFGRDYTPLFTVAGIADPFGTNGVGSSYNVANAATVTGTSAWATAGSFATAQAAATAPGSKVGTGTVYADPNAVRANNSVTYYSPAFNGFNASLMYSFGGENTYQARAAGTMTSIKLAYANGPVSVAYANQVTKGGVATTSAADTEKWTTDFLAAAYDLGVAKLSLGYKTDKLSFANNATLKSMIYGVAAPMGALTLKASFVTAKDGGNKMANQVAVGAVYDLSKRTSVYAAYSTLKNEVGYGKSVGSAAASDFTGLRSKGFEAGIKHNF